MKDVVMVLMNRNKRRKVGRKSKHPHLVWLVKCSFRVNFFWQYVHWKGVSPVCNLVVGDGGWIVANRIVVVVQSSR